MSYTHTGESERGRVETSVRTMTFCLLFSGPDTTDTHTHGGTVRFLRLMESSGIPAQTGTMRAHTVCVCEHSSVLGKLSQRRERAECRGQTALR